MDWRIRAGLEFLGIEIEYNSNAQNADVISTVTGGVAVRIMHTDEELMITKSVCGIPGLPNRKEHEYGQQDKNA